MRGKSLPRITICIPAKNDAVGLEKCLISIRAQNYPPKRIQLIVVDDNSSDNTPQIAKKYKALVVPNVYRGNKLINKSEVGKAIGLHMATGEYYYVLEQDIELSEPNLLIKMVTPLLKDPSLAGSFVKEGLPNPKMTWVTRFISYNPVQCDPMYEFFTTHIEQTIVQEKKAYKVCQFAIGKMPPVGRMMFRISMVKKTESWKWDGFFDLDSVCSLVINGYDRFAYIYDSGIYHYHASTLRALVLKRVRNLNYHYFPYKNSSLFKWFDISSKRGVIKIIVWVLYANLFFPALLRGLSRAVKHKDWVFIAEPIITILTTDAVLFGFIRSKEGRRTIKQALANFIQ